MLRLASASPRRVELLALLGSGFVTTPADLDESAHGSPALAKAEHAARSPDVTLAADTQVEIDGTRLGKPVDATDALAMLRRLNHRTHVVRTEVAVIDATGRATRFAVRSEVSIEASDHDVAAYARGGEPLDKAGAYAIQGEGRDLVAEWRGCLANVVGLPLCHTYFALRRAGVVVRDRPETACQERFAFICPVWRSAQRQGRWLRDGGEYDSWNDDTTGAAATRSPSA